MPKPKENFFVLIDGRTGKLLKAAPTFETVGTATEYCRKRWPQSAEAFEILPITRDEYLRRLRTDGDLPIDFSIALATAKEEVKDLRKELKEVRSRLKELETSPIPRDKLERLLRVIVSNTPIATKWLNETEQRFYAAVHEAQDLLGVS